MILPNFKTTYIDKIVDVAFCKLLGCSLLLLLEEKISDNVMIMYVIAFSIYNVTACFAAFTDAFIFKNLIRTISCSAASVSIMIYADLLEK